MFRATQSNSTGSDATGSETIESGATTSTGATTSATASTEIHSGRALWDWLEPLCLQGSVNLALEAGDDSTWPMLLADVDVDRALAIDVSSIPPLAERLERGDAFHLVGHVNGAMVTTSALRVLEPNGAKGCYRVTYPEFISAMYRRSTFRAAVRPEMGVTSQLTLTPQQPGVTVELRDLSLGGCLLAMSLTDAVSLSAGQPLGKLDMQFPNHQRLSLTGTLRHVRTSDDWQLALVGCEFAPPAIDEERRLWYCVKELEREGARSTLTSDRPLSPSTLFRSPEGRKPQPTRPVSKERHAAAGGSVIAQRLGRIASYLNAQCLQLQNGGCLASALLSRHADELVTLIAQSREATLYAIGSLENETPLVRHSLSVAIRATDLAHWQGYDTQTLKAIAASALIHDLGKASLPTALLESSTPLSEEHRTLLPEHVTSVSDTLDACRWLSTEVASQVIIQINERLDGSGYPYGLGGDAIGDLGRMVAVVDVIDALMRPRADRAAWPLIEAYRHVLGSPDVFDNVWVQRYVRLFGVTPIGSLVLYSSGALAWVQKLDAQGRPSQVHMVLNAQNRHRRLDVVLAQRDIDQLGGFESVVRPDEYGLSFAGNV